jgi:exodeoxyribonuclease-3
VLCGDFNVVPAAIDSYDEESLHGSIFHTDEERARFERLLAAGFVDVFRAVHPEMQAFSWWDYRGGAFHRKHGLRIDLLLATPPVVARVRSTEIDREFRKKQNDLTPSDHAPVLATSLRERDGPAVPGLESDTLHEGCPRVHGQVARGPSLLHLLHSFGLFSACAQVD